jgi:integrase
MYADGGGLYLRVSHPVKKAGTKGGTRSWMLRYTLHGRQRYLGLGAYPDFSLADARARARDARKLLADGIDPIAEKAKKRAAALAEAARRITFREAAEAYIADKRSGWRSGKHSDQWGNTLRDYAFPIIGNLPVGEIDTGLVTKILRPIWKTKNTTASRLRGRIESVLAWSIAQGHRSGPNPAAWRGHLSEILPRPSDVHDTRHHAALDYVEVAKFVTDVRNQGGIGSRALELTILTATRTGEAIGARWSEIDLAAKLWTIPPERLKTGKKVKKPHRVPLSPPAVALLQGLRNFAPEDAVFVFPGLKPGAPLSNGALLMLLERMGRGDITTHGFRASFRNWAGAQTSFPREVVETCLGHLVGDATERAYWRDDMLDRRRKVMDAWGAFCDRPQTAKVLPMRRKRES